MPNLINPNPTGSGIPEGWENDDGGNSYGNSTSPGGAPTGIPDTSTPAPVVVTTSSGPVIGGATDIGSGGFTLPTFLGKVLSFSPAAPSTPVYGAPPASTPGLQSTGTGVQNETDTAASNPPYNPNAAPIQQAVPTTPDNTAAALAALSSLFSNAFASGSPAGANTGVGGGAGNIPSSGATADPTIDPATGVPYADEQTGSSVPAASSSSSSSLVGWVVVTLTAIGVYFAYKQYKKSKGAKAA